VTAVCVSFPYVCVWFGAVCSTALAKAVGRRRMLESNQISIIADGAFTGLTALTALYGAGLLA
jgi:deoxyxylulose-5-phosphate synthase